jgi:hypothetical protein
MARLVEVRVDGLNSLLRGLRALPKEAQAELRDASKDIASRYMVPAWRAAAMGAGPWGPKLALSVRAKRDRIPSITIGSTRKAFSGGASPTMVRYPSHAGQTRESTPEAFEQTGWIKRAKPAYGEKAYAEWSDARDRVVRDFNNGGL